MPPDTDIHFPQRGTGILPVSASASASASASVSVSASVAVAVSVSVSEIPSTLLESTGARCSHYYAWKYGSRG